MSTIHSLIAAWQFNRTRTLALLDSIEQEADPQKVLAWRPGRGRAHIGWQLTHIAITEEMLACERLERIKESSYRELFPRFRGGSTPDDDVPSASFIRELLEQSRAHLIDTVTQFTDKDLGWIPAEFKARNLALLDILHIITWHEGHHQGQAHITFNLFKAQQS